MPLTTGLGLSDDYVHYNDGPMPPSIQLHGCHRDTRVSTNFPLRRWVLDVPIRFEPGNLQAYPHEAMFRRASETSMYVDPHAQYLVVPDAPSVLSRTSATRESVDSLSDSQHFAQQLRLDPDEGQQVKSEPPQADSPGEMDRQLLMHDKDPSQMTVPGRSIRDTNTTRTPSLLPHMMMYHSSPLLSRPSWVLSRDGKRQPRKSLSKGCSTKTTSDSG